MKLVAGLGNPGAAYRGTRHNVGFEVVDRLAARHEVADQFAVLKFEALEARWRRRPAAADVLLVKPLTLMNRSGEAVAGLVRYFDVTRDDLLVVCDDVNLPLGRLRARASGSEGGHNGLRSMAEHSARSTTRGCASASAAGTCGATWPTTCWPGSSRRKVPGLRTRCPGRRRPWRCGSAAVSIG